MASLFNTSQSCRLSGLWDFHYVYTGAKLTQIRVSFLSHHAIWRSIYLPHRPICGTLCVGLICQVPYRPLGPTYMWQLMEFVLKTVVYVAAYFCAHIWYFDKFCMLSRSQHLYTVLLLHCLSYNARGRIYKLVKEIIFAQNCLCLYGIVCLIM